MGRLDRSRFPLLSIYKIIIKRTIQCTGLAFHSALTNQGREYLVQISNALVAYCISLSFSVIIGNFTRFMQVMLLQLGFRFTSRCIKVEFNVLSNILTRKPTCNNAKVCLSK